MVYGSPTSVINAWPDWRCSNNLRAGQGLITRCFELGNTWLSDHRVATKCLF